jgi:hypothetical protein
MATFVKGWLLPGAIKMVMALAKVQDAEEIKGNVGEIGVHHGRLLILLTLLTRDGEKAVAVDLFSDQDRNVDHSGKGDLKQFKENLEHHANSISVAIHQGDRTELTSTAFIKRGEGTFRLISVDFRSLPIHEYFCQNAVWRSLRNFGSVKIMRGACQYARAVVGH